MKAQHCTARRSLRSNDARRAILEPLEGRRFFDASCTLPVLTREIQIDPEPVLPPTVLKTEFDDENAPHELRVTFDRYVWPSLDGNDLLLINEHGRFVFPSERMTVNWDFDTNTAHFVFVRADDGVLSEGIWHATLLAEGITDDAGLALDGDGDGVPGGNHNFDFHFLRGDATRDGVVDLLDFNILAANFGQLNRSFSQGDFNYDNIVNLADFNLMAARFGQAASGAPSHDGSIFGDERIEPLVGETLEQLT